MQPTPRSKTSIIAENDNVVDIPIIRLEVGYDRGLPFRNEQPQLPEAGQSPIPTLSDSFKPTGFFYAPTIIHLDDHAPIPHNGGNRLNANIILHSPGISVFPNG